MDFRRQSRETHTHQHRQDTCGAGKQLKFLGVHITEDLTWSAHTDAVLKKSHQRLFFLRWLRKFGMSPSILRSFYTCTVESILTGCNHRLVWKQHCWQPQSSAKGCANCSPHCWRGASLPPRYLHQAGCIRKARRIINDSSHPSHRLFSLLALRKTSPQHPIPH